MIKIGEGFVKLIDTMGTDVDIEQAARVSYDKGTRQVSDTRKLIRYLMEHAHTSPFEQVEFKFHIKIPLVVFSQLVRHRTASLNVRSYRYSEFNEEFFYPTQDRYKKQDSKNKQQSGDNPIFTTEEFDSFNNKQISANQAQIKLYNELLDKGCAREIARIHLPQSAYTELFWKIDLRNLLHFLKLRLGKDAQAEITDYARAFAYYVQKICPIAWEAFEDFELYAVKFTQRELAALSPTNLEGYNSKEKDKLLDKLRAPVKVDFSDLTEVL